MEGENFTSVGIQVWEIIHGLFQATARLYIPGISQTWTQSNCTNPRAQRFVQSRYEYSFGLTGTGQWNLLPKDINKAQSLHELKVKLGRFLEKCQTRNQPRVLDWSLCKFVDGTSDQGGGARCRIQLNSTKRVGRFFKEQ